MTETLTIRAFVQLRVLCGLWTLPEIGWCLNLKAQVLFAISANALRALRAKSL